MATISTRRHVLPNGLTLIMRQSRAVPIVSSWLWYRVGSRNEPYGMTGAAHWVEHMMFKGTPAYPRGQLDRLVARNGGTFNAFTHTDYTCYFETLPADKLDLALQIESDRMVNALFEASEVESERTVVISEREGLENMPEFLLAEEVTSAAFKVHPYHHEVIGWKSDLRSMTRDELYSFYRRYYSPGNAVLVLVGDLDPDRTLGRVEELFGGIPAVELAPERIPEEPRQRGERRVKVRQAGPTSYLQMAYHVPAATHPDAPALIVLDAILSGAKPMSVMRPSGGNRSSRLYRALVETEWATSADSSFSLTVDPGLFSFDVTARPERRIEDVEQALLHEVDRLLESGVSEEELIKARKQTRAQLAYSLESVANQAYWLGFFELLDSYERFERFEEALSAVTAEQVQEVARKYLTEDNRTVGHFVPTNTEGAAEPGLERAMRRPWPPVAFLRAPDEAQPPMGPETVLRRELDNGAVVLAYRTSAPSVVTLAQIKAGAVLDPDDRQGLASFTGSMLERGTEKRSFQQLNEDLEAVGATLRAGAGGHTAGIVGKSLAEDVDLLLDAVAEVTLQPTFPETEFRKLQGEILTDLREMDDDTGTVASLRFRELLYPAHHPYHYRAAGYVDTVSAMTRDDLQAFYGRYYDPRNATFIVVGDVDPERAYEAVARRFADWRQEGEPVTWALPEVDTPATALHTDVVMADKTQSDIAWGFVGLTRTDPRYYSAHLLDVVWGQLGLMGRLGERIREQLGLAYYVYSRLDAGFGPGPWSVRAGVNPANLERALAAIHAEAHAITAGPVTEEELADVKAFLTGSMPMRLETNEGLATALASIESFGLGLDYVQRYPEIINAVTAEEMLAVARDRIVPERAVYATAGPKAPTG